MQLGALKMKFVKHCLLTTLVFCTSQQANPQQPFSPCSTDMPVIVQNNFSEAMSDICGCLQTDIPQSSPLASESHTSQNSSSHHASKYDITKYTDVTIEVNNKVLHQGQRMTINVSDKQPLIIRVKSDLWSIINYLMELDLLTSYIKKPEDSKVEQNKTLQRLKDWTVGVLNYTYCIFDDCEKSGEHVYERNREAFLLAYAKLYKNTYGLFGGTLTLEIPIDAAKLKNEIIVDPYEPTVDFYDILDIVIGRLSEPEHVKYTGTLYKPIIQIG